MGTEPNMCGKRETPLRITGKKKVLWLRYRIHIPIFMFPAFSYLFSKVSWKIQGTPLLLQGRSRQLSQIKHLTSKWLISSQGKAMALGSKLQSCSASCSASST